MADTIDLSLDDTITGTELDDTISAGDGSDLIWGGDGNDTIVISGKTGDWEDRLDGGSGIDRVTIDLDGINSLLDFSRSIYQPHGDRFTLTDASGNRITLSSIEDVEIGGAVYSTQVQDHEGQLIDLENAVYIGMQIAGDDDGVFFTDDSAPMGSDLVYPAPPRDNEGNIITGFRLYGTDVDDFFQTVQLADGDSYVEAFAGDDYLEGGLGSDTLIGGTGDDRFRIDDGGDVIQGGAGNDTVSVYLDNATGTLADNFIQLDGGTGTDSLSITFRGQLGTGIRHLSLEDPFIDSFENISVAANGGDFSTVRGNDLANEITLGGNSGTFFAHGGDGNDTLEAQGYQMNATLMGGAGDDHLELGDPNGTLWGGDGDDYVYSQADGTTLGGGAGNDTLDGDFSDNTLYGGADEDVIKAGNGSDLIYGGAGDDVITTRYGADTIWGGAGDDAIDLGPDGEAFADHLWFSGDHGDDVVTGFFDISKDILHLGGTVAGFTSVEAVQAATVNTTQDGQNGILIDTGSGNSIFVAGLSVADLSVSNLAFD